MKPKKTVTVQLNKLDYKYLEDYSKRKIKAKNLSLAIRYLIDEDRKAYLNETNVVDAETLNQ